MGKCAAIQSIRVHIPAARQPRDTRENTKKSSEIAETLLAYNNEISSFAMKSRRRIIIISTEGKSSLIAMCCAVSVLYYYLTAHKLSREENLIRGRL